MSKNDIPDYDELMAMRKNKNKSKTLETTLPDYAMLKSLLRRIEIKYDVKAIIELEESFSVGLIFKTKMLKTFFHFEGERAKDAYNAAVSSIQGYLEEVGAC